MAPPISARSRARVRFCRRCVSALPTTVFVQRAWRMRRRAMQSLGHGLAKVALDPVVDSQPLIPRGTQAKGRLAYDVGISRDVGSHAQ